MATSWKTLVLGICATAAVRCVPQPLTLPDIEASGASSAILVTTSDQGIEAYALSAESPLSQASPWREGVRSLHLLLFDCDLAAMEIEPGPLRLLPMANEGGRPLPEPSALLVSEVVDEVQGAWAAPSAVPSVLRSLRFAENVERDACVTFVSRDYFVASTLGISMVMPWGDGFVASPHVGLGEKVEYVHFTRTSTTLLGAYELGAPQAAGYLGLDGRAWALGTNGLLSHFDPPRPFDPVSRAPMQGDVWGWLV